MDYVEKHGFGVYKPQPDAIAQEVTHWLSDPEVLQDLRNKAKNAGRPLATIRIAQDLGELLFEGPPPRG